MNLATEIRLMVYEYALSGLKDIILRSREDLEVRKSRHGQRVPVSRKLRIRATGLLLVSRTVFTEAMPVFYDMNRFHYTILPTVASVQGVLRHFNMHLDLMQYVSIDYMLHTAASDISEVDKLVSTRVRSVINDCPNLRTFTLHLLTAFDYKDLDRGLSAESETASELSKLAGRLEDPTHSIDWIAIVTHGSSQALSSLRDGIAPCHEWVQRLPAGWPDISIDEYQKSGIETREDGHMPQKIRMFYLWPAMRKRIKEREERLAEAKV